MSSAVTEEEKQAVSKGDGSRERHLVQRGINYSGDPIRLRKSGKLCQNRKAQMCLQEGTVIAESQTFEDSVL